MYALLFNNHCPASFAQSKSHTLRVCLCGELGWPRRTELDKKCSNSKFAHNHRTVGYSQQKPLPAGPSHPRFTAVSRRSESSVIVVHIIYRCVCVLVEVGERYLQTHHSVTDICVCEGTCLIDWLAGRCGCNWSGCTLGILL